jgi:hypothetical protein
MLGSKSLICSRNGCENCENLDTGMRQLSKNQDSNIAYYIGIKNGCGRKVESSMASFVERNGFKGLEYLSYRGMHL